MLSHLFESSGDLSDIAALTKLQQAMRSGKVKRLSKQNRVYSM